MQYRAATSPVATRQPIPGQDALPAFDGSQACAGADLELFFPSNAGRVAVVAAIREAKAICARCPVQEPCLQYALTAQGCSGVYVAGVWGGTTSSERRALRVGRGHIRHRRAAS